MCKENDSFADQDRVDCTVEVQSHIHWMPNWYLSYDQYKTALDTRVVACEHSMKLNKHRQQSPVQ